MSIQKLLSFTERLSSCQATQASVQLPGGGRHALIFHANRHMPKVRVIAKELAEEQSCPVTLLSTRRAAAKSPEIETLLPSYQVNLLRAGYAASVNTVQLVEQMLDLLAIGSAIVNVSLQVVFANAAAMKLLQQQQLLNTKQSPPGLQTNRVYMNTVLRSIRKQQLEWFRIGQDDTVCNGIIMPLTENHASIFLLPETLPNAAFSLLRNRFELTPGETRMVMQFVQTPDTAMITQRLHLCMTTVRTLLRTIYEKTEANSQQKLMKLLLTGGYYHLDPDAGKDIG